MVLISTVCVVQPCIFHLVTGLLYQLIAHLIVGIGVRAIYTFVSRGKSVTSAVLVGYLSVQTYWFLNSMLMAILDIYFFADFAYHRSWLPVILINRVVCFSAVFTVILGGLLFEIHQMCNGRSCNGCCGRCMGL